MPQVGHDTLPAPACACCCREIRAENGPPLTLAAAKGPLLLLRCAAGVAMSSTETIESSEAALAADPLNNMTGVRRQCSAAAEGCCSRRAGAADVPAPRSGGLRSAPLTRPFRLPLCTNFSPSLAWLQILEEDIVSIIMPLPTASSARAAAAALGEAIEEHGSGEGFGVLFSDSKEAWYLENAAGHHWLVRGAAAGGQRQLHTTCKPIGAVWGAPGRCALRCCRPLHARLACCNCAGPARPRRRLLCVGQPGTLPGASSACAHAASVCPAGPACRAPTGAPPASRPARCAVQEVDLADAANVMSSPDLDRFAAEVRQAAWQEGCSRQPGQSQAGGAGGSEVQVRRAGTGHAKPTQNQLWFNGTGEPFNFFKAYMENGPRDYGANYVCSCVSLVLFLRPPGRPPVPPPMRCGPQPGNPAPHPAGAPPTQTPPAPLPPPRRRCACAS